jgi:hypothetical protein
MDGDYPKQTKKKDKSKRDCHGIPYLSNILQSSWFRCPICTDYEIDRFILDHRLHFLLHLSPIFWIIFFSEKFKKPD